MSKHNNDHLTLDVPMHHIERQSWVNMPLPDWKALLRYSGWAVGRLGFSTFLLANTIIRSSLQVAIAGCNMLEVATNKLLRVYDALPHMGIPMNAITIESSAKTVVPQLAPQLADLLDMIQGKHVMIIGSTGTGKSTLAQWLAYQVASTVKVYDPDATPQEWQGLQVVGRGGDFTAIACEMALDLVELEERAKQRAEHGDTALAGNDLALIAEEFPALVDEIPAAADWLGKIARRGRKPKMFLCVLSQSDTVTALGIEGDGAIRSNFRLVRLGSHAVAHAKKLKRDDLVQWLTSGKYRAVCDDEPVQLSDLRGSHSVPKTPLNIVRVNSHPTESAHLEEGLQGVLEPETEVMDWQKSAVRALKTAGYSDSRIIKEVMGFTGGRYQYGKRMLANVLASERD